jgi:hypothetical protein
VIEQEEFFVAVIALLVVYLGILMRFQAKLLDLLDELAFPSDDPIMTSELDRGKPVFDYTTIEEEEEIPLDDAPEEAVELTPEEEEVIEEVMAKEEPEVYTYEGYELVYDESRCKGLNKSGRQCGRTPKTGEQYCNQHKQ